LSRNKKKPLKKERFPATPAGTTDSPDRPPVPARDLGRAAAFVAALTLAAFWRVAFNDFINLDDPNYVENPNVRTGLSWENVRWAFTSMAGGYWHPLAWISHMTDVSLFGMNAGGHHLTSLALHVINSALLLLVLARATRQLGPSTFVAALFAIHPLHVESVAWVASRKDVLSTLFWMLTCLTYVWYAERRNAGRYLLVSLCLTLGLLAKPMLVTLPFVLLLLDIWPLGRTEGRLIPRRDSWKCFLKLAIEKTPFFALVFAFSILAYIGQKRIGTVVPTGDYSIADRVGNAILAYAMYLIKMIWPTGLAPFYPHPADSLAGASMPWTKVAIAGLALLALTAAIAKFAQNRPYLSTGWLYYLGVLFPVIGLVQVANFGMADRYTYIALTGPFIMVTWGARDALARRLGPKPIATLAGVALAALLIGANHQVRLWQDGETLFTHTVNVTRNNYVILANLGATLSNRGQREQAIPYFKQALALNPDAFIARMSLGTTLNALGRSDEAAEEFKNIARVAPTRPDRFLATGDMLRKIGRIHEAAVAYEEAIRLKPDYMIALANLASIEMGQDHFDRAAELYGRAANDPAVEPGILVDYSYALYRLNRLDEARTVCERALLGTTGRDTAQAHVYLAKISLAQELPEQALAHADQAISKIPQDPEARLARGDALAKLGRTSDAIADYAIAAQSLPPNLDALTRLADALMQSGDARNAAEHYFQAVALAPGNAVLRGKLGRSLLRAGNFEQAINEFERALALQPGDPDTLRDLAEARRRQANAP